MHIIRETIPATHGLRKAPHRVSPRQQFLVGDIAYFVSPQEYTTERVKLEVMRDKMVEDMEKRGINPKVRINRASRFVRQGRT